jgi:hypothetical protein
MLMKTCLRSVLCLLFVVWAGLAVSGCATTENVDNAASRPWNSPRGWESGLPSGINEGR